MIHGKLFYTIAFLFLTIINTMSFEVSCAITGHIPENGLDYPIARWRGFKKAAYSLSFQDNYRYQVMYATPVLNQHNYKSTFFIVTNRVGQGWAPGWDTLNMLAAQGHEIASHSYITTPSSRLSTGTLIQYFRERAGWSNAGTDFNMVMIQTVTNLCQ